MMLKARVINWGVLGVAAVIASWYTMDLHLQAFGHDKIDLYQIPLHDAIMGGYAGNPWQYRVLAQWMLRHMVECWAFLANSSNYEAAHDIFVWVRYAQNFIIFLLMGGYYRKLGFSLTGILTGMTLLVWAIAHSFLNTHLQFNTYFDLIFYLLAALAILYQRYSLIIPIVFLAAFNRETSGIIPLMLLFESVRFRAENLPEFDNKGWGARVLSRVSVDWRMASIALLALLIYGVIFVGLRIYYAPQSQIKPHNITPGLELFEWNAAQRLTWETLFYTLGLFPILAFFSWWRFPRTLQSFFWAMLPLWIVTHAYGSLWAETRLFLVPYVIVLIPGVLLTVKRADEKKSDE